jgi:uncharacterized protein YjbI with pentapeptide repeats
MGEDTALQWGELPDAARQEVLDARLRAWEQLSAAEQAEREGPFAAPDDVLDTGVQLSGADVFYLPAWALAGPAGDRAAWEEAVAQLRNAPGDDPFLLFGPNLPALHLEGADLYGAHLAGAFLSEAHLEGADLRFAHLEDAQLGSAHLERARLLQVHLEDAYLGRAHLEGADLDRAHLERASLSEAHLERADLVYAHLEVAYLTHAHLEGADLTCAHLEGANLGQAHLEGKVMAAKDLARVRRWVGDFPERLFPADLRTASFDKSSRLNDAVLTGVSFDQVTFDNTNLTVVDWSLVDRLGDERTGRARSDADGHPKDRNTRTAEFKAAVRANRVLAVALRPRV